MKYLSSLFKFVYLIHIILACNFFVLHTIILKITSAIVLVLGAVILLYRLVHFRRMIKYPFIPLYVVFMISYVISVLMNIQYGWYDSAKITVWMTLQFAALYLFDPDSEKEYIHKEFTISMIIIISVISIMNFINDFMLLMNYFNYYEPVEGTIYLVGVAFWGRLFGTYADPNYSSVMSVVAFVAAFYLLKTTKRKSAKIGLIISMVLQAFYISCCASRTGLVTICVSVTVFSFINTLKKSRRLLKAIMTSILLVAVIFVSNKLIIEGYNLYTRTPAPKMLSSLVLGSESHDKEMTKIGRDQELEGDISNRRFDLWKNAIKISKTAPITGISFGNIVSYAQEKVPDSYLLTNGYVIFNAFHNMFFDLLVSQGLLGVIIFLTIIFSSLRFLLKNRKCILEKDCFMCIFLFSICTGILSSSFFVSEILYVNNQVTVFFWTLWGYLIYFVRSATLNHNEIKEY